MAAGNISDRFLENVAVFNRSLTFPVAVLRMAGHAATVPVLKKSAHRGTIHLCMVRVEK